MRVAQHCEPHARTAERLDSFYPIRPEQPPAQLTHALGRVHSGEDVQDLDGSQQDAHMDIHHDINRLKHTLVSIRAVFTQVTIAAETPLDCVQFLPTYVLTTAMV